MTVALPMTPDVGKQCPPGGNKEASDDENEPDPRDDEFRWMCLVICATRGNGGR